MTKNDIKRLAKDVEYRLGYYQGNAAKKACKSINRDKIEAFGLRCFNAGVEALIDEIYGTGLVIEASRKAKLKEKVRADRD